jgi:hypothetical protein
MAHSLAGSEIIPRCSAAVVRAKNSQCAPMTARPPSSRSPRGVCLWPLVAAPPPRLGGAIYRRLRSFSTHASLCSHSWSFRQAGHRNGIVTPDSDSNLIASVVSPVGTGTSSIGQRIIIFGIVTLGQSARVQKEKGRRLRPPLVGSLSEL